MLKISNIPKAVALNRQRDSTLKEVVKLNDLLAKDHIGKRIHITLYDEPARSDRPSQIITGWDIHTKNTPEFASIRQAILAAVQQAKTEALQQIIDDLTALGVEVRA